MKPSQDSLLVFYQNPGKLFNAVSAKDCDVKDIINLTLKIKTKYSELYSFLDENTLILPFENYLLYTYKNAENYLETLHQILKKIIQNIQNK